MRNLVVWAAEVADKKDTNLLWIVLAIALIGIGFMLVRIFGKDAGLAWIIATAFGVGAGLVISSLFGNNFVIFVFAGAVVAFLLGRYGRGDGGSSAG